MQKGESEQRGRGALALRVAAFYSALFFVAGTKLPYLPVWLDWRGLTAGEIAVVAAAPLFLRILATPFVALIADRWGDHRRMVILLAWCSLALVALMALSHGFWPILAVTLLMAIATTSIMPLTETIAMDGVRRVGADYGRMRLWGSLSFIAASFLAGLVVERQGAATVAWLLIAGAGITALAAHALPPPWRAAPTAAGTLPARPTFSAAGIARLLATRWFLLFLAAVGLIQAAHAVFYTFGVLHWRTSGYSEALAGLLWAIGVITEIALFAVSGTVVRRVGALGLLAAGGVASALRWTLMALDPPLGLLVPLQALHGLSYGATHIGAVHLMAARVAPELGGTAQAVYASVTAGIAMGLATLLAGRLYPWLGGQSYLAMTALAVAGLGATIALRSSLRQPQSAAGGGAI